MPMFTIREQVIVWMGKALNDDLAEDETVFFECGLANVPLHENLNHPTKSVMSLLMVRGLHMVNVHLEVAQLSQDQVDGASREMLRALREADSGVVEEAQENSSPAPLTGP